MADAADRRAAADFLTRTITRDAAYISHGEIQCGRSPDGASWADDIAAQLATEIGAPDPDRDLLVVRDAAGAIRGAAVVGWTRDGRTRFAVLEDLAVDPELRSQGVGARIVAAVEAEARTRGLDWVFLESGLRNRGAHEFFAARGYGEVSRVFAKRLGVPR